MMIKITVQGGVVQDVETSEPALVQLVDLDSDDISTLETVAQAVEFDPADHGVDTLLNHEVMSSPLKVLFRDD